MKEYKKLPELDVLPRKPQNEIDQLRIDLRRGYDSQLPIMIWKGRDVIVDGNHRYDICREEGIEAVFKEEEFEDLDAALCYVWKHYIQCDGREKTPTQRATGILRYDTFVEKISKAAKERKESGINQYTERLGVAPTQGTQIKEESGRVSDKLAKLAGTGATIVKRVLKVKRDGIPELEPMMMNGELSAEMAKDFVKNVPKYEQEKIVKEGGADAVKNTVIKIREVDKNAKKFDEFNDPLKEKNKRDIEEMRQVKELASTTCLLPNLLEKYCETCKWGFDVYIPSPHETEYCPYCGGKNIVNRKPNWNSRLAAMQNE